MLEFNFFAIIVTVFIETCLFIINYRFIVTIFLNSSPINVSRSTIFLDILPTFCIFYYLLIFILKKFYDERCQRAKPWRHKGKLLHLQQHHKKFNQTWPIFSCSFSFLKSSYYFLSDKVCLTIFYTDYTQTGFIF